LHFLETRHSWVFKSGQPAIRSNATAWRQYPTLQVA